jgi:hypothetical protein
VLLAEPFSALDAGLRTQLRTDVATALRRSGTTAVLVTHDQDETLSMAELVAVLCDGRIAQAADPATLYQQPVDAEVARFVGEANLLAGHVLGRTARSPLGEHPLRPDTPRLPATTPPSPSLCRPAHQAPPRRFTCWPGPAEPTTHQEVWSPSPWPARWSRYPPALSWNDAVQPHESHPPQRKDGWMFFVCAQQY